MSLPSSVSRTSTILLFSLTIFISSTLLFSIQPMFAKLILPNFGGAPQVWNTCMMFYQLILLSGYVCAHLLSKISHLKVRLYMQVTLVLLPLLMLPVSTIYTENAEHSVSPMIPLLTLLSLSVGLPFFILSMLSPLLQKWFSYSHFEDAQDPYFLYAASNFGSFFGLLSYPLIIEPWLTLEQQHQLWAQSYYLLVALIALCSFIVLKFSSKEPLDSISIPTNPGSPPTVKQYGKWLLLAFIPSSMMLGVSTHITTELFPIPLLWILPLSLYLLTMVLSFARHKIIPQHWLINLAPGMILLVLLLLTTKTVSPVWLIFPIHLLMLFVISMIFHSKLFELRPSATYLTNFYISLAVGGALGGIFNAIISPAIFNSILEYPITLILASLFLPQRRHVVEVFASLLRRILSGLLPVIFMVITIITLEALLRYGIISTHSMQTMGKYLIIVLPFFLCYLLINKRFSFSISITLCFFLASHATSSDSILHRERSFYGNHIISENTSGSHRMLHHGITMHGIQNSNTKLAHIPGAYYHPSGPAGQIFIYFNDKPSNIGVIGLGIGSLPTYLTDVQTLTFFEIDPTVIRIAENTDYFSFISKARERGVTVNIIEGDARLTMNKEENQSYDLLVVDAFTSGTIPMHLITQQAIQLYSDKIKDNGLIMFNISNHYLDFTHILCNQGNLYALNCLSRSDLIITQSDREEGKSASQWLILTQNDGLSLALAENGWDTIAPTSTPVWSDDYSNIFDALRWKL